MGWTGHIIFGTWQIGMLLESLELFPSAKVLQHPGWKLQLYSRYRLRNNKARAERRAKHDMFTRVVHCQQTTYRRWRRFSWKKCLYAEIFSNRFIVVFEGWGYFFKKKESLSRAAQPLANFQAGTFSEAWRVCDCLAKQIIFEMKKPGNLRLHGPEKR